MQITNLLSKFAMEVRILKRHQKRYKKIEKTATGSDISRTRLLFPKSFGGNILCKQTSTSCTNGSKQNPAPKVTYIYRLVKKQAKLRVKTTSNRKNKGEFAALDLAFERVFLVFLRPGRQEISLKTR